MKKSCSVLVSVFLSLSFCLFAFAQERSGTNKSGKNDPRLFPLEEVKPGMKGIAKTVFSGGEPEEFGVEILGVMPGFPNPKQSAIIIRLTGEKATRTGVFGGMSGSPVYIDGRLAGAIAFSFPFSKEPIGGVTPIQQMIDIFEQNAGEAEKAGPGEPRKFSFTELASTELKLDLPKPTVTGAPFLANVSANSPLINLLGQQMMPIATPVVFNGISQETLNLFAAHLQTRGLLPVSSVGGAAEITPLAQATTDTLKPGASVSAQLLRGDYSLAASGTVTWRDGDKIYAFGHPFLSLGTSDMPMTESSVVTVIPNTNNSFKLAVPGKLVGSFTQDRSTGIYGHLGQAPKMIPVKINLRTSRNRVETYSYEVATDEFLTPLLLQITIFNTIASSERTLGNATVSVSGQIDVRGQSPIKLERRFSAGNAPLQAAGSVAVPVNQLLTSGFDEVHIKNINLDLTVTDSKYAAELERVTVSNPETGRGETVEIQAYVRTESGKQFVQRIPVEIPKDAPLGQLLAVVSDGQALQQSSVMQAFSPTDLDQLVSALNKIKKNDRLYVKLFRITSGAVIGANELPNLPPSMVATLNSERSAGGYTPTALSPVYEKELPPAEFVIKGQQIISIEVVR
jgi:hypothetical protein